MRRGQTSLEFLFLIAFMFIIFVSFFVVIQERTVDLSRQRDYQSLKEVNNLVKYEIKNAQLFDDGYRRPFWMPIRVEGKLYTMNISEDAFEASYSLGGVDYLDFFDNATYGNITYG